MTRRPGRLYRRLNPPSSLFTVTSGAETFGDDELVEISVTRGDRSESNLAGFVGCTMAYTVAARVAPVFDAICSARLTPAGAAHIAAITGVSAAALAPRFYGRVGVQDVEDHPVKVKTTVSNAGWGAQLTGGNPKVTLTSANNRLFDLYAALVNKVELPPAALVYDPAGTAWDTVYFENPGVSKQIPAEEVTGKYAADLGILVRTYRDGKLEPITLVRRQWRAGLWREDGIKPLLRRQVLAPARWRLPVTSPAKVVWRAWHDILGNGIMSEVGDQYVLSSIPQNNRPLRTEEHDLRQVDAITNQIPRAMKALCERLGGRQYVLDVMRIDLLVLLTSDAPEDRHMAGQLLTLEHGDPVILGADWPIEVRGIHFAVEISERITRDEWTIDLAVLPYSHVAGPGAPPVVAWADLSTTSWLDTPDSWAEQG